MRVLGEIMTERHCVGKTRQRVRNQTLEEFKHTFWSKVIAGPKCCILWTGVKSKKRNIGSVWHPFKKRMQRASRVAYELHFEKAPGKKHVLHSCDNPICVNPNHLFLGTHQDNMDDMHDKGRFIPLQGVKNGNCKLTEAQVLEIRRKYIPWTYGTIKLAKEFGVTQGLIMAIISRKAWKHI